MDIEGWLRELGLGQYEQLFRDNAIDTEILSELTDSDLERLGVLLGHRRKLLKAIAALRERAFAVSMGAGSYRGASVIAWLVWKIFWTPPFWS
jgi:hypothetical protein